MNYVFQVQLNKSKNFQTCRVNFPTHCPTCKSNKHLSVTSSILNSKDETLGLLMECLSCHDIFLEKFQVELKGDNLKTTYIMNHAASNQLFIEDMHQRNPEFAAFYQEAVKLEAGHRLESAYLLYIKSAEILTKHPLIGAKNIATQRLSKATFESDWQNIPGSTELLLKNIDQIKSYINGVALLITGLESLEEVHTADTEA
ncbi:hypothetical protein [Listeria fleischmannii]|uniref:Uncharacterized protein n=1 Tax=Listeria fleischmannii TaxID=1069827 RepID=A0A841YCB5_9LIST|nr:hypothetical protein [Listeria fleischmannii]MBC1397839.1 hypothetical protein [Listeria fleischmannii]MBC1427396.1 hypothetical protein [Listeria fleischmannii]